MPPCDGCGTITDLPYRCTYCGGTFCGDHRLPENHGCPGLEDWDDPSGVFDSGFDATLSDDATSGASGLLQRLEIDTGPGGPLGYFRGNITFVFLALMWVVFFLQVITQTISPALMAYLFVLEPHAIHHVWTWVTSIFAHGDLFHIIINSIVLYFFGPLVERRTGSQAFAALFLVSGILAGVGQVGFGLLIGQPGPGVVGASGAILAIMGVLTVLNPQLRVLLFFFIPMPLWMLTVGFALFSVFVMVGAGLGAGDIAHLAHLIGLVLGLAYGKRLQRTGTSIPDELRLGGGPPGGPGRGRF